MDWKLELAYIQPGKPVQNAHVESFNARLRDECLNVNWFRNLWQARRASRLGEKNIIRTAVQQFGIPDAGSVSDRLRSFASQFTDAADPRGRPGNPAGACGGLDCRSGLPAGF